MLLIRVQNLYIKVELILQAEYKYYLWIIKKSYTLGLANYNLPSVFINKVL